ncbi:MAG: 4-alpha-glucanotransferase [Vicinamibacteria bacterium]|jgi:4-alpha-glucanotransferase|nr:4-alpha-glucanotransferase [Vicinamibacteria bacterium]
MTLDPWGITDGYHNALGEYHATSDDVRAALRAAMCAGDDTALPAAAPMMIARQGTTPSLDGPAELRLEDGTVLRVEQALPCDLPIGYHELHRLSSPDAAIALFVTPGRCHLPESLRAWGFAVQLYALRSANSWGIGDLGDLRELAAWSDRSLAADLFIVNPLYAVQPNLPQQSSPYYPSSRLYRNPLYLDISSLPGASDASLDIASLATAAQALNATRMLDRDAVFRYKMEALERLWPRFGDDPRFARYQKEQGETLRMFATHAALSEHHGGDWRLWPAEMRKPHSAAVTSFAETHRQRVRFHAWLQWLLDEQLAQAARALPLIQDLPVGFDPGGADAWLFQDLLALDVSIGAPPDDFNPSGQKWGLPPFIPHRLDAARYQPFISTLRATLRHAYGLRIDHVMGLFRLFWVPGPATPDQGAYVRYPSEALLAITAIESQRARALIVGEDLGTVELGTRERLAESAILSYRLLCFEEQAPAAYPQMTVAAVTTHDLPTIAGLVGGQDLETQKSIGAIANEAGWHAMRERVLRATPPDIRNAPIEDVIARVYETLAQAPAAILSATLEDAVAEVERPNRPGTTVFEWPNWSLALPCSLEALKEHPLPRAIAAALKRKP